MSSERVDNSPLGLVRAVAEAGPDPEVVLEATRGWYWAAVGKRSGRRVIITPMRTDYTPSDPGYAKRVRASFDAQPMMTTLGVNITGLGPGWIDLEFDHHDDFTQQHGFKHAGAIATALDSACGYAAFSLMPKDAAVLTVEYKINLMRPARAERYRASATVLKPGRTLTVCSGTATPADSEETIAVMTATLMTLVDAGIQH